MLPKNGVIFDLDDTIISTSPVYYDIIIDLLKMVSNRVKPSFVPPERVLKLFELVSAGEILDLGPYEKKEILFEELGSSPETFPYRVVETFVAACLEGGVIPTKEDVVKAWNLGNRIFTANYKFMPGARNLIYKLSRRLDTKLFLITQGSEKLQRPKLVDDTFLNFDRITICGNDESKSTEIKKLISDFDNIENWAMIGDDVNRDINPALSCGIWAIHVSINTSPRADGDVIDIGDTLKRYKKFYDIGDVYYFLKEVVFNSERIQV